MLKGSSVDTRLVGVWENPATGHVAEFSAEGVEVYHRLDDFCIGDTGVVPDYSLYRLDASRNRLELQYFDYRRRSELLQAPQVFTRLSALPEACRVPPPEVTPPELFGLVVRSFDRFYRFFDERHVDWQASKRAAAQRAAELSSDLEVFELLSEMLAPLSDGHVNMSLGDQFFNAGRSKLRTRLGDAWKSSGSEQPEGAFVAEWHRSVVESVVVALDPETHRKGADEAIEWGMIESVGYVRINRFYGFADGLSRSDQYEVLAEALSDMRRDLLEASRLIVDVSMNGGGSDAAALLVTSYFADRRRLVLTYEATGAPSQEIYVSPVAAGESRPVTLLTSEVTASAAESFVLMMRALPHVTHAGEQTRGGLSSLLPKPFPSGLRVTLAYQSVLDAEGVSHEGTGIPPEREMVLFPDADLRGGLVKAIDQIARGALPASTGD